MGQLRLEKLAAELLNLVLDGDLGGEFSCGRHGVPLRRERGGSDCGGK